jgi:hypothetical protein
VKSSTGVVSHVASKWKPQQPPPSATSNVVDVSNSDDELEALRFKPRSTKSSAASVFHPILDNSARASDIQEQEESELQAALRMSLEDLHSTSQTPSKLSAAPRIGRMPNTSPLVPLRISPNGPNFAQRTATGAKGSKPARTNMTPVRVPNNAFIVDLTEDCGL